jgi:putative toxin-antitoxin system antitoxin component (TIGR02293 family)
MGVLEKQAKSGGLSMMHLLGGAKLVDAQINSEFDLIALSNKGLKKASLDALIGHLGISKKAFAENILHLSVKTFERKKDEDLLDSRTSSHLIEIAKVVEHAFDVFGDETKAQRWLNSEIRALNFMKPIDLFHIPTGLAMVDNILGRIEYGVYS